MSDAIVPREPADLVPTQDQVGQLVDLWLVGFAPRTGELYREAIADFERVVACDVGDALLRDRGRAHAAALGYRARMLEHLAPATINVRLAALRSLTTHARRLGLVGWALDVPGVKSTAYRDTRGPGARGFARLLAAVAGDGPRARRDRAILWCLFGLGLRRAEVCSLDIEHVDLDAGTVSIMGKGKREREALTMPAELVAAMWAWLEAHPKAGSSAIPAFPLFVSLQRSAARGGQRMGGRDVHRLVVALGKRAGVSRARPHALRHAAVTSALDLGADVRAVQRFSRHADLRTLQRYDDARRDLGGDVARLVSAAVATAGPADGVDP